MGNDDAKRLILARRARFVAAALAGVAVACGGSEAEPEVCLSPLAPRDAGGDAADAQPQPCLEPTFDAGKDAEPQPCLSPLPPDAGDAGDGGDASDGG
jgi:hypothetical protein